MKIARVVALSKLLSVVCDVMLRQLARVAAGLHRAFPRLAVPASYLPIWLHSLDSLVLVLSRLAYLATLS